MSGPHLSTELTSTVGALILAFAATIIIAGSLLSFTAGRHVGMAFATQISLGLEFLLAAGLIRLASAQTLDMLGIVAAIIVLRRTVSYGIGLAVRAAG